MNPKVSIIVPVYNSEKYLKKCIQTIVSQTYDNYEIIVVNDGSTDNSLKILKSFSDKYINLFIINQSNSGSSEARKTGLRRISKDSKYFCFCDSDDYISENYISRMVEVAEENDSDIVQSNFKKLIGPVKFDTFISECFTINKTYNHDEIMNSLYISYFGISNLPGYLHTKLYKSSLKDYFLNLPTVVHFMADDLSLNIRILPKCNYVSIINDSLYYYRIGGGTSKFMPEFMNDYFNYHSIQKDMIKKYTLSDKYKYYSNIEIVNVFKTWLEMCYKNHMTKDSLQYEYIKWMNNESFNKDVLSLKGLWSNDFYDLIIENDFNDVYVYIKNIAKKSNFKSKIKNSLISFANLIG